MTDILMSIRPEWVELICEKVAEENGKPVYKKKAEIRKTKPNRELPVRVLIYCTKDKRLVCKFDKGEDCYGDVLEKPLYVHSHCWINGHIVDGKVVGEFICKEIKEVYQCNSGWVYENARVNKDKFFDYLGIPRDTHFGYDKKAYAWIIEDLKIYDEPKELSEFYIFDKDKRRPSVDCEYKKRGFSHDWCLQTDNRFCNELLCDKKRIKRPPQSWCYVEVRE